LKGFKSKTKNKAGIAVNPIRCQQRGNSHEFVRRNAIRYFKCKWILCTTVSMHKCAYR